MNRNTRPRTRRLQCKALILNLTQLKKNPGKLEGNLQKTSKIFGDGFPLAFRWSGSDKRRDGVDGVAEVHDTAERSSSAINPSRGLDQE